MKTVFTDRTANIIAKIRTITSIDKIDEEVIFEILQAEFKDYYNAGYDAGYDELCWESYADGKSNAYDEGYYQGYSDRRSA